MKLKTNGQMMTSLLVILLMATLLATLVIGGFKYLYGNLRQLNTTHSRDQAQKTMATYFNLCRTVQDHFAGAYPGFWPITESAWGSNPIVPKDKFGNGLSQMTDHVVIELKPTGTVLFVYARHEDPNRKISGKDFSVSEKLFDRNDNFVNFKASYDVSTNPCP